jgi:ribosomal protein S18 acetylase RimI-like enzyme
MPWYLGSAARYCLPCGEVYATEGVDGVAAWLPPGKTRLTNYWHMLRSGMLLAPLKARPAEFSRLMALRAYTEAAHERLAPERHWYLFVLGTAPERQGQGIGGALMSPVLARADAEKMPCYLETQYERNLSFYERHGFEVVETGSVPDHGPRFWSMLRKP